MDKIFQILLNIIWILSILLVIYSGYFIFFSLLGFTKMRKPKTISEPRSRILVIIAARNEELVIGNLIDSLMKQNYPRELFDVLVVTNNCTDRTAEVSRLHGAHVLECTVTVRSKGEALAFLFQNLPSELISDAYCVFDADNVVHCDFLHHMDQARCAGAMAATGYRDSKNPHDTIFSACASIFYWMGCRFYGFPRSQKKLSAIVNGTGFMFSAPLLDKLGGFHMKTLAEDFEFTTQCILAGERVVSVPEAITFDEQALTLVQSWKQRQRWMIGFLQVLSIYFKPFCRQAVRTRKMVGIDFVLYMLNPIVQYFSYILFPFGFILRLLILKYPLFPLTPLYDLFLPSLAVSIFVPIIMALTIALADKKIHVRLIKGILVFPFFLATQVPINIISLFKYRNNFEWEEIQHTRIIKIDDLK